MIQTIFKVMMIKTCFKSGSEVQIKSKVKQFKILTNIYSITEF